MGGGVRDRTGGIIGLHRLLLEHGEAVEYDLITLGLRLRWLGTERLTWRDLLVIVRHCSPTSALARALVGPEEAAWSSGAVTAWLLAAIHDVLQIANWQRAGDEKHPAPMPKFIPRPGDPALEEKDRVLSGKGIVPMDLDELDKRLGWDDGRSPRMN